MILYICNSLCVKILISSYIFRIKINIPSSVSFKLTVRYELHQRKCVAFYICRAISIQTNQTCFAIDLNTLFYDLKINQKKLLLFNYSLRTFISSSFFRNAFSMRETMNYANFLSLPTTQSLHFIAVFLSHSFLSVHTRPKNSMPIVLLVHSCDNFVSSYF